MGKVNMDGVRPDNANKAKYQSFASNGMHVKKYGNGAKSRLIHGLPQDMGLKMEVVYHPASSFSVSLKFI